MSNRPYVVSLEISILNAIDFLINNNYSIDRIISELHLSSDFVKHFELLKTYENFREKEENEND
jgi:hypothetical protein